MKKQYKIQLPKGKKVTKTNVDFENGVMTVNVELENESTFGRIATENLDKAAKERINEHDKQIDKILKMENDKDVLTAANMILQEYGENIRWKKQPKCMRTLYASKLIDEIDASISKRVKELRELFDIKEQKYEPKDGDILYGDSLTRNIIIYKGTNERGSVLSYAGLASFSGINRLAICDETNLGFGYASEYTRYATDEEKRLLFDALAKEGKRWNPETKQIEDFPRWRAEEGEAYFYLTHDVETLESHEVFDEDDDVRYEIGNYFKTREAAEKVAEQIREIFKNSKEE